MVSGGCLTLGRDSRMTPPKQGNCFVSRPHQMRQAPQSDESDTGESRYGKMERYGRAGVHLSMLINCYDGTRVDSFQP
jgi:hypothetical protein